MTKQANKPTSKQQKPVTGVKATRPTTRKAQPAAPIKKRKPIINRKPHTNYKFIDLETRVDVIYDNFTHNLQPLQISRQRNMKYNTVRSLLENYYQQGRINVKKKQSGYQKQPVPQKQCSARTSTTRNSSDRRSSFESMGGSQAGGTRHYRRQFLQNKEEVIPQQKGLKTTSKSKSNSQNKAANNEKHIAFIKKGPQSLNLSHQGSKCNLGLFICQQEHLSTKIKENKVRKKNKIRCTKYSINKQYGDLQVFISNRGEYPYDVYDIQEDEIDKQPSIPSSTVKKMSLASDAKNDDFKNPHGTLKFASLEDMANNIMNDPRASQPIKTFKATKCEFITQTLDNLTLLDKFRASNPFKKAEQLEK